MMQNSAGSYAFETLEEDKREKELERLKGQVSVFLPVDRCFWETSGLTANMTVLDLGCGSGIVSCELARLVQSGQVVGVDLSESMLTRARWFQEREQLSNLAFQQNSAYELDFAEASFDFVYARLLFQHLTEPAKVLARLYQLLKPGGILCAMDADDGGFILYPEPDGFGQFRQAVVAAQQARGGDPFVGRKLGSYFQAAGFAHVKTLIKAIDSDEVGLKTLIDLLTFGVPYQSSETDLSVLSARARQEMQALVDLPYAWMGISVLGAFGRKPC